MPLIRVRNVTMGYDNHIAVDNVSFDVYPGDYILIVGANGSGKSTLMKGVLGLKPLKAGTIEFGDGLKSGQVGYLPQRTVVQQDFPASVFEVVLSGCLSKLGKFPFYTAKEKNLALKNLKQMGMEAYLKKSYRELSGGQQQRVLLARALCATSKILLLDEPMTGLDMQATKELYDIIYHMNIEHNITILMVSHDLTNALKGANKVLHIEKSIQFFGRVSDYIKSGGVQRD